MLIISEKASKAKDEPEEQKKDTKPSKDDKSNDGKEEVLEKDKLPSLSDLIEKPEGAEGFGLINVLMSGVDENGEARDRKLQFVIPDEIADHIDISQFMDMVMEIGNSLDDKGLHQEANKIDTCLAELKKISQYEGFQGYWIANGRAFEKAYKAKRDSGKSPQDCWMEVLEEYQDSLLSGQNEFNKKYAGKKAVEEADGMGGGGTTTMSKEMSDRAKRIKEKADKEGKSEGQATAEWLEEESRKNKKASTLLLKKIAGRLSAGEEPGVAFYEAITELKDSKKNAIKATISTFNEVLAQAQQQAPQQNGGWLRGLWDAFSHPFKSWWAKTHDSLKDKAEEFKAKYTSNPVYSLVRQVQRGIAPVQREFSEIYERIKASGGVSAADVKEAYEANKFAENLRNYLNYASKVVSVMPAPDPANYGHNGILAAGDFINFYKDLNKCLKAVNSDIATEALKKMNEANSQSLPSPVDQYTNEDKALELGIKRTLQKMNNMLKMIILLSNNAKIPVSDTIFPGGVDAKVQSLNLSQMLNEAVHKMRNESDLGSMSLSLSSSIINVLDADFDHYMDSLSSLVSFYTQNPSQTKALNQTYGPPKFHIDKLVNAWEKAKEDLEKTIETALKSKFDRVMTHRSTPQPQQQA